MAQLKNSRFPIVVPAEVETQFLEIRMKGVKSNRKVKKKHFLLYLITSGMKHFTMKDFESYLTEKEAVNE